MWPPEPITGLEVAPSADAHSELASDLSVAFLVVLERLAPEERAAFLLHEVFDSDYADIAGILGKSEAACRQIVHRARRRVRQDRPRFAVSETARARLPERFLEASRTGSKSRSWRCSLPMRRGRRMAAAGPRRHSRSCAAPNSCRASRSASGPAT